MKKYIILICTFFMFLFCANAQHNLGFNYQAVVMDNEGSIVKDQDLLMRIQLYSDNSDDVIHFEEIHRLKSNQNGVVNTTIGSGNPTIGRFSEVPWKTKSIWIHVAIDLDMDQEFEIEHFTQLLAVPYALYALEAEKLASKASLNGETEEKEGNGDNEKYWKLIGNKTPQGDELNRIGTINENDILLITSNTERVRITANGPIIVKEQTTFEDDVRIVGELDVYKNIHTHQSLFTDGDVHSDANITAIGNVYFMRDMYVGLNSTLDGELDVNKQARFNDKANSFTKDDGAVVIEHGGLGVEGNTNIGGNISQDDKTDVATFGQTNVTNETNAVNKDSGALIVEGGAGIEKDLHVGGNIEVVGDLKASGLVIDGSRTGPDDQWDSYPVQITGETQGIAVGIKESPDSENNFITFFDENKKAVGRIEGQNKIDILESEEWIIETTFQSAAIASSLGSFASQAASDANLALEGGRFVVDLTDHIFAIVGAAFGAVEGGAGVGDLVCVAVIAVIDLAYSLVELSGSLANNFIDFTVTAFDAATNIANFIQFQSLVFLNSGSTFSSGSADYAEYLPKLNAADSFKPGDVVGIVAGKVTKDLENATQIMVVSSDPIVVGNMPAESEEHLYEKVAFMGQVPVKVEGSVKSGDYLIAKEDKSGFAKAVSPNDMTLEDCKKIVGVSWGGSELAGTNYVNTAIGLNKNDVIPVLENQIKEMQKMKVEINEIKNYITENERILGELVPGYLDAKQGRSLEVDSDLLASVQNNLVDAANANLVKQLEGQNVYGLLDQYAAVRRGDSHLPIDKSQIISMLNTIDTKHNLNLSPFSAPASADLQEIEAFVTSVMNTDYIAQFKTEITSAVSQAVQVVADQILDVKEKMINDIASGASLNANEKNMLKQKIDKILPIFSLMENSGQITQDITDEIFDIIDAAACNVCSDLDKLPIQPEDITDMIQVPVSFFLETVDFFVNSLTTLNGLCIAEEICIGTKCAGFSVCPFGFIPDINFDVNDIPFVDNKKINIQFPDMCASINCN